MRFYQPRSRDGMLRMRYGQFRKRSCCRTRTLAVKTRGTNEFQFKDCKPVEYGFYFLVSFLPAYWAGATKEAVDAFGVWAMGNVAHGRLEPGWELGLLYDGV